MLAKRTVLLVFSGLGAAVGIALIVLASVAVPFVNNLIEDTIKSKAKLSADYSGWSSEDVDKFVTTDTNYTYRAFDILNVGDIIHLGARPILKEIGPFTVKETSHKYNVTWKDNYIQFQAWWQKQWVSESDRVLANDVPMTSLNPAYIAAISSLNTLECNPSSKETSALPLLTRKGLNGIGLEISTGSFVQFLRTIHVYALFTKLLNKGLVNVTTGTTNQWWNTSIDIDVTANPEFVNKAAFQINGAGLNTTFFDNLWVQSNFFSLANRIGAELLWPAIGGAFPTSACRQNYTELCNCVGSALNNVCNSMFASGGGIPEVSIVLGFLKTITNTTIAPTYENVTVPGTSQFLSACENATTFSDLAFCQLGSSGITTNLGYPLNDPSRVSVISLDPSGNLAKQCASIGAKSQRAKAADPLTYGYLYVTAPPSGCTGPEFNAYRYGMNSSDHFTLTWQQAKALYFINENDSDDFVAAFTAWAGWDRVNATYKSALTNVVAPELKAKMGKFGFNGTFEQTSYIFYYASMYIPNFFLPEAITFQMKTGIFTTRPPAEIMFGYTPAWKFNNASDPHPYKTRIDDANNDQLLQMQDKLYPGLLSNWTDENFHYLNSLHGFYQYYTGADDLTKARRLKMWRNASSFSSELDFPYRAINCTCVYPEGVNKTFPIFAGDSQEFPFKRPCKRDAEDLARRNSSMCSITCPPIWNHTETIDGTTDGLSSQPFLYRDDQRLSSIPVFSSEAMRILTLTYQKDVEVKGIRARRYILPEEQLRSDTTSIEKYRMTEPSGAVPLSWWYSGIPVCLSRPFFWGALNTSLDLSITGSNMMVNVTGRSVYDPEEEFPYLTYIDIEPTTGYTIRGHKRLQYTLKLSNAVFNIPYWFDMFNNNTWPTGDASKAIYWPAFWADENGVIKDDDASSLKSGVYFGRIAAERLEIGGLALGGFFVLLSFAGFAYLLPAPSADLQKVDSKTAYYA